MGNRLLLSYFVTDEIFGLSSSVRGELNPWYNYGAATVASPGWVLGTFLGALAGNLLSPGLSSALGVALYAMFLAVVIPAARTDKAIAVVVAVSMAGSVAFTYLPGFSSLSSETRIILLTILIASLAATAILCKDRAAKRAFGPYAAAAILTGAIASATM